MFESGQRQSSGGEEEFSAIIFINLKVESIGFGKEIVDGSSNKHQEILSTLSFRFHDTINPQMHLNPQQIDNNLT